MGSKLYYHGTPQEVRLGDRIELRTAFLRRRKTGTVVCIPEKTALELANERKQPDDWLIKLDDGTFTGWLYHPEEMQPPKRVTLVARADGPVETVSNRELEAMDAAEANKSSGLGDFVGCLIAIILMMLVVAAMVGLVRLFR